MANTNMIIDISGNLTGFTRFFVTSGGETVADSFDFDYRNQMRPIPQMGEAGNKAYALAFSRDYIATSLVLPSHDSFRRWGIITVSVIIPRGYRVVDSEGKHKQDGTITLLKELYDRFAEKCIRNRNLTDSLSILSQDYYADIIGKYSLVKATGNQGINRDLDPKAMTRSVGYVKSAANDISKYLEKPQRAAYTGNSVIVISENDINSELGLTVINEPPVEEIVYIVYVTNIQKTFKRKLSEKIPHVQPESYQIPLISQDFTLEQVLNGEAPGIIARQNGTDSLSLTYRFKSVETPIALVFKDGPEILDPDVMNVVLENNAGNSKIPGPSGKVTFVGQEITQEWKVVINNPSYNISGKKSFIPSRITGGEISFNTQKGFPLFEEELYGDLPEDASITISRIGKNDTRRLTYGESIRFLPGDREEWTKKVECEGYEPWTGALDQKPELEKEEHVLVSVTPGKTAQRKERSQQKDVSAEVIAGGRNSDDAGRSLRVSEFNKYMTPKWIGLGCCALAVVVACIFLIVKMLGTDKAETLSTIPMFVTVFDSDNAELDTLQWEIELVDAPKGISLKQGGIQRQSCRRVILEYPQNLDQNTNIRLRVRQDATRSMNEFEITKSYTLAQLKAETGTLAFNTTSEIQNPEESANESGETPVDQEIPANSNTSKEKEHPGDNTSTPTVSSKEPGKMDHIIDETKEKKATLPTNHNNLNIITTEQLCECITYLNSNSKNKLTYNIKVYQNCLDIINAINSFKTVDIKLLVGPLQNFKEKIENYNSHVNDKSYTQDENVKIASLDGIGRNFIKKRFK